MAARLQCFALELLAGLLFRISLGAVMWLLNGYTLTQGEGVLAIGVGVLSWRTHMTPTRGEAQGEEKP